MLIFRGTGAWNTTRLIVTTNVWLSQAFVRAGLQQCITIYGSSPYHRIGVPGMGATIEAVIGAAHLDGGLHAAKRVIHALDLIPSDL